MAKRHASQTAKVRGFLRLLRGWFARANHLANCAQQRRHLRNRGRVIAKSSGLVKLGELRHRRHEIRHGNCRSKLLRCLRRRFLPATFFQQPQHFAILERSERRCNVSAVSRPQAPAHHDVGDQASPAQVHQQRDQQNQQARQKIRRRLESLIQRDYEVQRLLLLIAIIFPRALAPIARSFLGVLRQTDLVREIVINHPFARRIETNPSTYSGVEKVRFAWRHREAWDQT